MEWNINLTTRLIGLFKNKRVLWDSSDLNYKDRSMKHDAWAELAADLQTTVNEVEKKTRKLIGQFQREFKKGKRGIEANASYKTKWAFFNMLLFLKDKNKPPNSVEAVIPQPHLQDIVRNNSFFEVSKA